MVTLYGDSASGNCHKARWVLDLAGVPYRWEEVEATSGRTRSPEFLALNPAGQVPLVVFGDGRTLAQSNAILLYFGEAAGLVPADPYLRAKVHEWLFWEQYSHEPYVAVRRFQLHYLKRDPTDLDPKLLERGDAALNRLEQALTGRDWLVGDGPTVADLACLAYTRLAAEGGFDLEPLAAVQGWIARGETLVGVR